MHIDWNAGELVSGLVGVIAGWLLKLLHINSPKEK